MKSWLEQFTNIITMEKLVLYSLAAIVAIATLLSSFGFLSFSPGALVASTAVLVFVSYGTNLLLGRLYGVGVSSESPVITALILALIINPTLDVLGLAIIALTAIIAMASKFVLAIRGRHVFNPAAIAVLLVGFTGLQYATWWVATPPLLPIVLITAFLVLYKTRHLLMGSIFFLIAATIIILTGMVEGFELGYLAAIVVTSYPLIFFAGFMLSEPLTLPPRRYQKLLLAGLAGVGVALPFHIGGFVSSPEAILVAMNLVAFLLAQRKGIRLTLKEVRDLTPTVKEFVFNPAFPVRYVAGQYIELNVPQIKSDSRGTRRSFSIVSQPAQEDIVVALKYPEKPSAFKRALAGLEAGQTLSATRVSGDFILPKDPARKLLFVAGGIGITPFVSHIRDLKQRGEKRDIVLVYAAATVDELAYVTELRDLGVTITAVCAEVSQRLDGVSYITAPYITKDALTEAVADIAERTSFVSGPPLMVEAVRGTLKSLGTERIKTDHFSGY